MMARRRRQYGVLVGLRVQLTYALIAPRTNRPRCRTPPAAYRIVSFHAGGAPRRGATDMANQPGGGACGLASERLSAYLDGELEAGERGTVEAHLAGCEACTA